MTPTRDELFDAYALPDRDARRVRMNFIESADGAVTLGGRSGALGGETDRAVMQVLRTMADVLMIGAGTVRAEGDLDFRGTLGVAKEVPVGFQRIRLHFDLETDAPEEKVATLIRLTERYCVVYQTLRQSPEIFVSHTVN